jgi:hypothetical protein
VNVNTQKAMNFALLVGCAYEIVALLTRSVPTITRIVRLMGTKPVGKVFVWLWAGYVSWHFLEPMDS